MNVHTTTNDRFATKRVRKGKTAKDRSNNAHHRAAEWKAKRSSWQHDRDNKPRPNPDTTFPAPQQVSKPELVSFPKGGASRRRGAADRARQQQSS